MLYVMSLISNGRVYALIQGGGSYPKCGCVRVFLGTQGLVGVALSVLWSVDRRGGGRGGGLFLLSSLHYIIASR